MEITTKALTIANQPVRIHGISTGRACVKMKFRETNKKGALAALSFLLDKNFTEWLPVRVWVIEHPEGIFLIDTGVSAKVTDESYYKACGYFAKWFNKTHFGFNISREDEIDRQLNQIGISTNAVNRIILTHLHLDHVDGLKHFPKTPVMINRSEWEKPFGNVPELYPDWFNPEPVSLDRKYDSFNKASFLTDNQDMIFVETPGHTHGHASVLLKTDQAYICFAGDVVYHQSQLLENKYAGANADFKAAKTTYASIKRFAENNKTIFLPSHDMESTTRLVNMQPLQGISTERQSA